MKSNSPINSTIPDAQSRPNSPESFDTATEGRDSPRSYDTATEGWDSPRSVSSEPFFPPNLNQQQTPPDSPRSVSSEPFFPPDPNLEQSPPNSPLGPNGGGRGRGRAG